MGAKEQISLPSVSSILHLARFLSLVLGFGNEYMFLDTIWPPPTYRILLILRMFLSSGFDLDDDRLHHLGGYFEILCND